MNELNIKPIIEWFEQAKPEPTIEDACVQIGCHYEEISEMAIATGDAFLICDADEVARKYKKKDPDFLVNIELLARDEKIDLLDSLCDQIVTAVGVAYMLKMDIQGALNEVNRSNWSKFVDGKAVFNDQGKIAKSENYTPPQLVEFVK